MSKVYNTKNNNNLYKKLRAKVNLTQSEVAKILNLNRSTISQWERGNAIPDQILLPKLANLYNVSTDYLLGVENEKNIIVIQNELSEDENYLIDLIRHLDMKDKSTIYELTELMVHAKKNKTK